jgi:hypothetical protein
MSVDAPGSAVPRGIDPPSGAPVLGDWIWLFPLAYGAHLAEELWIGGGLPAWLSDLTGAPLTVDRFIDINATFFVLMVVMVVVARWGRGGVIVILGSLVGLNGLLHLGLSLATMTYSPGTVTGILAWLPLGFTALRWGRAHLRPLEMAGAVAAGVLAHVLITLTALGVLGGA